MTSIVVIDFTCCHQTLNLIVVKLFYSFTSILLVSLNKSGKEKFFSLLNEPRTFLGKVYKIFLFFPSCYLRLKPLLHRLRAYEIDFFCEETLSEVFGPITLSSTLDNVDIVVACIEGGKFHFWRFVYDKNYSKKELKWRKRALRTAIIKSEGERWIKYSTKF